MLKKLLAALSVPDSKDRRPDSDLALAVVLLELARADFDHDETELEVIRSALIAQFGLSETDADSLMSRARKDAEASISLFDPVSRLNEDLDYSGRCQLLEWMWKIVLADGRIDPKEEHLLRRLSDLMHLSPDDFVRAKLAASEEASL